MGSSALPLMLLLMSFIYSGLTQERPKAVLSVHPDRHVFSGETVTLTCDIQQRGGWQYSWYKDGNQVNRAGQDQNYTITPVDWYHSGVYSCFGSQSEAPHYSQFSEGVRLTVSDKPQPTLTVNPQSSVFTGDTVTLSCDVGQSTGWTIHWSKGSNTEYTDAANKTIKSVSVSDEGNYWCRAQRGDYYSEFSNTAVITVKVRPKPVVYVQPDENVFRGETVTLTCHIQETGDWRYSWYKDNKQDYSTGQNKHYNIPSVDWSNRGVYSCKGTQSKAPTNSQMSDGLTLTVSDKLQPTLTVNPQSSVFTGDTVTLSCDVGQLTGWTIHWRKDSNTESTDAATKTIESANDPDGGRYQCRAQRGKYYSDLSKAVVLTVKVRPKAVAHVQPDKNVFRGETVTLTCHIQEKGDWRYSWYKDNKQDHSTGQNQKYIIPSVASSHSGVYSCKGTQIKAPQYSQFSDGVTLTVSDLTPKPELTSDPAGAALIGNTVTFTCRMDLSTGWDFYWYKHTLNSETKKTETNSYRMKIDSVSDGGQFWCRAGRGKPVYYTQYSDALWVNVTGSPISAASSPLVVTGVVVGLSVCLLIFILLVLLWRYKKNKDQQRNINQTSVSNQSAESQPENSPLQSGSDHICDVVTEVNKRDKDDPKPLADVTYSEVTVKKKMKKDDSTAEPNNVTYSEVRKKEKKSKSKNINTTGPSDLVYAEIDIQDKKKTKGKGAELRDFLIEMKSKDKQRGKSSESGDTLYSELKHNTDRDADATYAQPIRKKNKTRP